MPLPVRRQGVGDAAVWQDTLHEVIAQKNDLLCDIQLRGSSGDLAIAANALPASWGRLCNRIFANALTGTLTPGARSQNYKGEYATER